MLKTRVLWSALSLLILTAAGSAQADLLPPAPGELETAKPRRPFDQGSQQMGLVLGYGSSQGGESFVVGGSYGYYVMAGLAPGLEVVGTLSSDTPNNLAATPFLRYTLYRSYDLSPYLLVKGGRVFVAEDVDDYSVIGPGAGFVYFLSRRLGVQVQYYLERAFGGSLDCSVIDCNSHQFGLGLGFFP